MNAGRNRKRKSRSSAADATPTQPPSRRRRPTGKEPAPSSSSLPSTPASTETISVAPSSAHAASSSSQHSPFSASRATKSHRDASSGQSDRQNESSPSNTPHTQDAAAVDKAHQPFTFFTFPGELRNMIYAYSLIYPSSRDLYRAQLTTAYQPTPTWTPRLRAPTILLLSKRITAECLPLLHARTLTIDRLPPARFPRAPWHHPTAAGSPNHDSAGYELIQSNPCSRWSLAGLPVEQQHNHFMRLADFVAPQTLQSVRLIDVNVGLCEGPLGSGWAWRSVVEELLGILTQRNRCARLRLLVRLCNTREDPVAWAADAPHLYWLRQSMEKFANDNPNVFAQREIKLEVWKIDGHDATYLMSHSYPELTKQVDEDRTVVVDEDGNEIPPPTPPKPRRYPDKEMFPGSVMQFAKAVRTVYRYAYSDSDHDD